MQNKDQNCEASCWRGPAGHPMAAAAACKRIRGHVGYHEDKNGNRFVGGVGIEPAQIAVMRITRAAAEVTA